LDVTFKSNHKKSPIKLGHASDGVSLCLTGIWHRHAYDT